MRIDGDTLIRRPPEVVFDAVLAEQHDEWAVGRRYISQEALRASQLSLITEKNQGKELSTESLAATA